jgi:hypothetical protein
LLVYRDETEAAFARIAELEVQLRELKERERSEETGALLARIANLEDQVALKQRVIDYREEGKKLERAKIPFAESPLALRMTLVGFLAICAGAIGFCIRDSEHTPAPGSAYPGEFGPRHSLPGLHDDLYSLLGDSYDPVQVDVQLEVSAATDELASCDVGRETDVVVVVFLSPDTLDIRIAPPYHDTVLGECVRDVLSIMLTPRGPANSAVAAVAHVPSIEGE